MHTHEIPQTIFKFRSNKELSEIYVSVMIRTLAITLIAVFIPIYLYSDLGFSLSKVILFLMLLFSTFAVATPASAHLASRIGFKHSMLISTFFYITAFLMLGTMKGHDLFFYLVPVLLGVANSIYWLAFHVDLAKFTQKKYRGRQTATWQILAGIAAILGPFLAGLILEVSTFSVLFIIGSGLLLVSTIPLFGSRDQHLKSNFSYKSVFKRENLRDMLIFTTSGIKYVVEGWIWPYLFLSYWQNTFSLLQQSPYLGFSLLFPMA